MGVTATTDNKPVVVIEGPPVGGPSCIESSRFQKLPSIAHVAAGAFGFLIFNHAFDGPDLYGASSFFETIPSSPSLQAAANILSPWGLLRVSRNWMPYA
jgi:hypothetical protein